MMCGGGKSIPLVLMFYHHVRFIIYYHYVQCLPDKSKEYSKIGGTIFQYCKLTIIL